MKLLKGKPGRKNLPKASLDPKKKIAEAAYYLAEKRSFEPGSELDDWLMAETMFKSTTLVKLAI